MWNRQGEYTQLARFKEKNPCRTRMSCVMERYRDRMPHQQHGYGDCGLLRDGDELAIDIKHAGFSKRNLANVNAVPSKTSVIFGLA